MKTLHLTNAWSETSGGVATFYRAMMQMANRRQHSMVLVVPGKEDSEQQLNDWVRVYHLAAPFAGFKSSYRTIYPSQFLTSEGKLREILKRERPDVVEIADKYSLNYLGPLLRLGLAKEMNFRPVVIGLSCERMDVNFETYLHAGELGRTFCKWYMRYLYFPFFDHHIAVSDETSAELRNAAKGHEIPRGVFTFQWEWIATYFRQGIARLRSAPSCSGKLPLPRIRLFSYTQADWRPRKTFLCCLRRWSICHAADESTVWCWLAKGLSIVLLA